jgi:hypothetical protein
LLPPFEELDLITSLDFFILPCTYGGGAHAPSHLGALAWYHPGAAASTTHSKGPMGHTQIYGTHRQ